MKSVIGFPPWFIDWWLLAMTVEEHFFLGQSLTQPSESGVVIGDTPDWRWSVWRTTVKMFNKQKCVGMNKIKGVPFSPIAMNLRSNKSPASFTHVTSYSYFSDSVSEWMSLELIGSNHNMWMDLRKLSWYLSCNNHWKINPMLNASIATHMYKCL